MEKYSMFQPKDRRKLTSQYPELKENRDLEELTSGDLKFCWNLGCETSDLYDMYGNEKTRQKAIETAIDRSYKKIDAKRVAEINKAMPRDLEKGIEAFVKYNVSIRVRSQKMLSKIIDNMESAIDVDMKGPEFIEVDKEGQPTGRIDFDARKKYTDMAISIVKNMGDFIAQSESGFATHIVKEEDNAIIEEGMSMTDFFHESDS
jgi:hypothetical protein